MKLFFTFLLSLTLLGCAFQPSGTPEKADNVPPKELWKSADNAYRNQDWQLSYSLYSQISDQLTDADIEFRKGVSAFRLGRIKAAEQAFESAIEIQPSHKKALFNLAIINISRGYAFLNEYNESLPIQERPEEIVDILKALERFSTQ
ncbi:tetratricopeptide repeat protein [Shewanella chilikensis]|jgi:tetratricopeptide (TPR) repeat protein|uniref:tetratricopeptide repeat protein n=1 Tax=Shewanella chilikensis TaxID=558541 RepID=UPI003A973661